ncbi:hypothetical protein [Nocardia jiangsuensis]|uniref:NERD domain-containing protein n=1 Tax=Nocardia jiangsuensis TaxID=1691563 RepID=A0ABV8E1Q1_9NOCA
MIVIAQDSTFSGPEKLVRRWFESWHGPDRGLGGLAVFGCKLPGVAGGPGRRADVLVWTPGHCTVVEIAGLRRSQSGVLDTEQRWRIGSAPADLDLPVASLTPDVRAAQTATGLRARLKRAGLPELVGELAVLVTAPGSAVSHPEPLEPTAGGVVVAGSADPDAVERYFRRQTGGEVRWDIATLTAAFAELELAELLPSAEALAREGFAAAAEISAAEVAAQGAVTAAAEPPSGGDRVTSPGVGVGGSEAAADPSGRPGAAAPQPTLADDASDPAFTDDDLEPADPRRAESAAPERVPAMASAAPGRPPWLAPIPPLPERPRRRAGVRTAEPSAITEVDAPRRAAHPESPASGWAEDSDTGVADDRVRDDHAAEARVPDVPIADGRIDDGRIDDGRIDEPFEAGRTPAATAEPVRSAGGRAAPAQTWRPEPATDEPATDEPATDEPATDEPAADEPASSEAATPLPPRAPIAAPRPAATSTPPTDTGAGFRQPAAPWTPLPGRPRANSATPGQPPSRGVRLTRTPANAAPAFTAPSPYDTAPTNDMPHRPRPTPPPAEQRPPRRLEYSADPQPLRPRQHYSPPPSRGDRLRSAFDTESWPRLRVGGTALLLALATVVAVFFVGVHVARENRPALADYAAMCDEPNGFAGAAAPKPGPVGLYAAGDLGAVTPPGDPGLPRATRPEDVQWVACATRTGVGEPVANCRYQDGSELALIAGRYRLTVYEAATGRTVHSADVPGDWFAPGTIPIGDPCAAAAGAAPDQPGQRFGRPAPDRLRQFLTDAARLRNLPS